VPANGTMNQARRDERRDRPSRGRDLAVAFARPLGDARGRPIIEGQAGQRSVNGTSDTSEDPDRRRSGRHSRRAADAAGRRGVRGHARALTRRGARTPRGLRVRPRDSRSELHARHHVGPGRARPDGAHPRHRPDTSGAGGDGVEQRERRRRSDAARRARLHREAMGRRTAAGDHPNADRPAAGAATQPAAPGSERQAPARRHARFHRRLPRHSAGAPDDRTHRGVRRRRADHRRARHRQGSRRHLGSRTVRPQGEAGWSR
jgi:hypothetical protein